VNSGGKQLDTDLSEKLKRQLGFERLRLRGPSGARDEFLLAATAQNLKRLARLTNQLGCFA